MPECQRISIQRKFFLYIQAAGIAPALIAVEVHHPGIHGFPAGPRQRRLNFAAVIV